MSNLILVSTANSTAYAGPDATTDLHTLGKFVGHDVTQSAVEETIIPESSGEEKPVSKLKLVGRSIKKAGAWFGYGAFKTLEMIVQIMGAAM